MIACAFILNYRHFLSKNGVIFFNIASLILFAVEIFLTTLMWLRIKIPDFPVHLFVVWILTIYSNAAITSLDHLILIVYRTHGVSERGN